MSSWNQRQLASVTKVFADGDWIESKDQSDDGVRLIQTGNVGIGVFKGRAEKARYISEETFQRLRCTQIVEGDCLISRLPDPVGRSCILPKTGDKMITAVDCTIIRFDTAAVIPEFFCYYSQSRDYLNAVETETSGTTRKRISRSKLGEIRIPVPPLPEQRRIVAVLDEAFEGLAIAIANTEKNLKNAREVFDGYLTSVFAARGKGWEEKTLGQACRVERGSSPRPIKNFVTEAEDGQNWVKIGDTKRVFKDIYSTKEKITKKGAEQSRRVDPGDLILTNSMSYGRPYVMQTTGYIHDGWFALRLPKELDTDFMFYLLSSRFVQDQFHRLAAGAIVLNISGDLVKQAILPIPNLKTQLELVDRISRMYGEVQRLEEVFLKKQKAIAELKQSLLQKAFAGELTKDFRPEAEVALA